MSRTPFPVPFGWFQVCWPDELELGGVKPLFYFGLAGSGHGWVGPRHNGDQDSVSVFFALHHTHSGTG